MLGSSQSQVIYPLPHLRCSFSFGLNLASEKVPSAARFHRFLSRIRPFSIQSPTAPHSNRRKVSGENPALFQDRGMPSAVFRASWHFLSEASCAGGRAADKKAKPPIKRQILGSPDVLGFLLHWQLFLLFTPNNRVSARISTFHEISVQLLLNIMRQRDHFSKFFLAQNPPIPCRNDTGHLRVLAIFPN